MTLQKRKHGIYKKGQIVPVKTLPEYRSADEVQALIQQAPNVQARMIMLCQWRAGLRVSEALALAVSDIDASDPENPVIRVRLGKGRKQRIVPLHPELANALETYISYANIRRGPIFTAHRATAWNWVQKAAERAVQLGACRAGAIGTHTLRHSAARHWLASGVPINHVQRWLGHSSIQTTMIYLEILPDPMGLMERVP